MWSFIILATLGIVYCKPPDWITPEMMDMIADDKARCMGEHGTSQALIDEVNDGALPNDRSLTCYMVCLLDTFGVIEDDGTLDSETLIGFLPDSMQDEANTIFEKCSGQSGADKCDKLYNIAKCAQDTNPKMWFMI